MSERIRREREMKIRLQQQSLSPVTFSMEPSLNTASIKTMLLGIMLMLFGGIVMVGTLGAGGLGFFFALVGLMVGVYGFSKP